MKECDMGRLICVACGAGINTSTLAEDAIIARMVKEGLTDVEVKRVLMADIETYVPHMNLLVSMMKIYRTFDVPTLKGMPFLIGTKEEKDKLLDEIVEIIKVAKAKF
jgi:galactitol-specific phosphotransferase system IIB component